MKISYPKHHAIPTGHIARCQVCNGNKLHLVLDLGHQPLCDSLLTPKTIDQPEITFPLRIMWCQECSGVQIDYCVSGAEVYHPDYPYRSGITKELREYLTNMSTSLVNKFALNSNDLVVDIGSNDGTMLMGFKQQGIRVLGVEPTNIAKIALKLGIPTVQSFFDIKTSKEIKKKYGPASLIVSTNTFAHMQTLGEFIIGVYNLLKKDGVFVSETHYLLDVIKGGQFDTFYHEHLRTYSLKSLITLFNQYDFTLTHVERGDRYGGNIRVFVTKGKGKTVDSSVRQLLSEEKRFGLDKFDTYQKFASRVQKARLKFMEFLIRTNLSGKHVVGNSCPARSSTLLNYYGVDTQLVPYIAEQPTSLKLGMYLPGKHIPIVNNQILLNQQPDYVIILAWHYARPIMEQLKARGLRSDFVIPLPDFRIIRNASI